MEMVATLRPYIDGNPTENEYQREIENCLKFLGWKSVNKTMQSQVSINIGNNKSIRPDIVLYKNEDPALVPVLPIEIKRPSNTCSAKQQSQLKSYMRQLRLNVGLYIGENIQLYYDNPRDVNPICVLNIEFRQDDTNGEKLCDLLFYPKFDIKKLEDFCKERYNQIIARNNLQQRFDEFLSPNNAVKNVRALIKEKFIKEGYEEDVLDDELQKLSLSVVWEKNPATSNGDTTVTAGTPDGEDNEIAGSSDNCGDSNGGKSSKNPVTKLKITFGDGSIIMEDTSVATFKQFVEQVGITRVESLNLRCRKSVLISPVPIENHGGNPHRMSNGYYLYLNHSTLQLEGLVEKIASKLNIDAHVEIVPK